MENVPTPVDGPFRITVEPIPTGVTLDVESFVQHVVQGVIKALLNDEVIGERFDALFARQSQDPYVPERSLPVEELVADLVAVVGTKLPVYGLQALRLSGWIERLATPTISELQAQAEAQARTVESVLRGEGGAAA
jgi:hypothetical protein